MELQPKASHYIHGRYVDDLEGEPIALSCPATAKIIAVVHSATEDIVNSAVESSKKAQTAWARLKPSERGRILHRAAEILLRKNDEIAAIETKNTGRVLQETLTCDILCLADLMKFFAGAVSAFNGESINLGESSFAYTRHEPFGVCLGIGAWNYPIYCAGAKAAPALAMGNSMVFKPSERTPLSALILAETFSEAGLPDGVFNVVQGKGDVAERLACNSYVAKISLTGSVTVGQKLMALAGARIKHTTMELGGKSPILIFEDADYENALNAVMMANFYSNGQVCSNGTRIFLHKTIEKAFLESLCARVRSIRIGNPLDPEMTMGPLINRDHQKKVLHFIEEGKREGAVLCCGGGVPKLSGMESGFFVEPTVFSHVNDKMIIAREEIFGPVASVFSFSSEDEAIARANDTDFGLAAGVFTRDIARAHRVAAKLQVGTCWINNYNLMPAEIPFGGIKQSGIGKENSLCALANYTQLKSVYVEMGDVKSSF